MPRKGSVVLTFLALFCAILLAATPVHAAPATQPSACRIALVSDPHVSSDPKLADYLDHFERVIDAVNVENVDAVLLAGDLAQSGNPDSFAQYIEMQGRFKARAWAVAGNHDVGNKKMPDKAATVTESRLRQFAEGVGPNFFAEEVYPGVQVIGINGSILGSGLEDEARQWQFLESELSRPRQGVRLLLTHYPPFAIRPDETDEYFNINVPIRQRLMELLQRGGVKAVLSGHLHRPVSFTWDGIQIIGAPAVSFGLPKGAQRVGWTLLTLHGDGRVTSELRYLDPAATARTTARAPATAPVAVRPKPAAPVDLKQLGPIAVLPMPDPQNHVLQYLREKGLGEQLRMLTPEEVIDPQRFNPGQFKACLYLSGERYQRTAKAPADIDRAIRAYREAGGVLVVLSTGPYPFYQDEQGNDVTAGAAYGLILLGNGETEDNAAGFDQPPAEAGLWLEVKHDALGEANLPERLAFPDEGDRRWRPMVGSTKGYEPWIRMRDRAGHNLGDAAGWTTRAADGPGAGRTAYASYLLTQQHPQSDQVLDAVFAAVSREVLRPEPAHRGAAAPPGEVSDRVHVFYYNWYGAPPHQKSYVHWQQGGHNPPDDIGSNYYPRLGPYSSSDPSVLRQHMQWIRQAGIGVLSLSWWGRDSYEDKLTAPILAAAADAGLKVNFHVEPYDGFKPDRFDQDIAYLLEAYGKHPAFYRAASMGNRPLFYVFETLKHPASAWRAALDRVHTLPDNPLVIAQTSDLTFIESAGFDGGYPYDVLTPFKTPRFLADWNEQFAQRFAEAGKLFVPSVGPGYWDDRAVPRGADEPVAARTRDNGQGTTYDAAWQAALKLKPPFITVTSFNEWHEGSQIEPATAHQILGYRYPGYPEGEDQYLRQTARWVKRYTKEVPAPRPAPVSRP